VPEPRSLSADERRRRRAFVLAHHPDRGGDAETFVTGLAALQDNAGFGSHEGPTVYRRRRGLVGWLGLGRPRPPTRTLR
jgi:hypothetical protein